MIKPCQFNLNFQTLQLNRCLGGSVPNFNANSAASSRRSSRVSCYSVFSGRDSVASSRRSSGPLSRPGSRRGSLLVNNINYPPNPPVSEYRSTCTSWPDPAAVNSMHDSLASLRLRCESTSREYDRGERGSLSSPSTPPISSQQQATSSGASSLFNTIGSGVVGSSSNIYCNASNFSRNRHRNYLGPSPFQRPKYRDRYFL